MTVAKLLERAPFLVDTNVISHLVRPKRSIPDGIVEFLKSVDEQRLYLSAVTIGEIQKGIDLIPWPQSDNKNENETRRRLQGELERRLEALCSRFADRIIELTVPVLRQWGRFHAETERNGRKTPVVDTLIASCAHVHRLVVASADGDFSAFAYAITIYNPIARSVSGYEPYYLSR